MKFILKFSVFSILFFGSFLGCKNSKEPAADFKKQKLISPEKFIAQYQKWLDVNDFESASQNATEEEKWRLDDLKNFVFKTQETLDSSLLETQILHINCVPKNKHTICVCKMKDQFEVYDITFYLKKVDNHWLMDAPQEEEKILQDEELQKIIDSIFLTMENKFQQ